MAFEGTDDFTHLTTYHPTLRADARRFEMITLPFQDFAGMNASLELLLELGVGRIEAYLCTLHAPVRDWAARRGYPIASPVGTHGSQILCVVPPDPGDAFRRLKAAGVVASLREGAIASPHVFNTLINGEGDGDPRPAMRPLRIAYLVTAFPVISEAPFLNQITGLVERGHHVDIFAVHPERGGRHHADVDRLGLLRRTYYPPAPPAGVAARWAGALELLWQHRGHGGEILGRALNIRKFGSHASSLSLLYSSVPFLPGRIYDIIQGCFGPDGIKAERLRAIGAGATS
jgi:hypothetical protein